MQQRKIEKYDAHKQIKVGKASFPVINLHHDWFPMATSTFLDAPRDLEGGGLPSHISAGNKYRN